MFDPVADHNVWLVVQSLKTAAELWRRQSDALEANYDIIAANTIAEKRRNADEAQRFAESGSRFGF